MELDEAVAKMMGWERVNIHREDHDPWWTWQSADGLMHRSCIHWKPSTNWHQAALVIEWMKGQGFTDCNINLSPERARVWFGRSEWWTDDFWLNMALPTGKADDGPEAICRAALEAMGCPTS